jgi:phosphoenolpyruvate carboxykinase (ATP)
LTRGIVDAIHTGTLADIATKPDPIFGVGIPVNVPGVDAKVLQPRATWADGASYDATAKKLAHLFVDNFKKYEAGASAEIRAAAPNG